MSEPAKPADSAAKATDDFVTKYKVRLTLRGIQIRLAIEGMEKLLTLLSLNRLGLFVPSLCLDYLHGA
jgi:hypothetical protein